MDENVNNQEKTYDEIKGYMKLIQSNIMALINKEREDKKLEALARGEDSEKVDLTESEIKQLISDFIESYYDEGLFEGLNLEEEENVLYACTILENIYHQEPIWFERMAKTAANKKILEDKKPKNIIEKCAIDAEKNKNLRNEEELFCKHFGKNISVEMYRNMLDVICHIYSQTDRITLVGLVKSIQMYRAEAEKEVSLPRIQEYIRFLNYYGILDTEVENINDYLKETGVEGLEIFARNPLGDEYRYKGNSIDYKEAERLQRVGKNVSKAYNQDSSIGIIDAFEDSRSIETFFQDPEYRNSEKKKEYKNARNYEIEKAFRDRKSIADNLILCETTYGYEYGAQRNRISDALNIIMFGKLWDKVISGDERDIDDISDIEIENAKQRVSSILEVYNNPEVREAITTGESQEKIRDIIERSIKPSQKGNYTKKLKKLGFYNEEEKSSLTEDASRVAPDMMNLCNTANNFYNVLHRTLARFKNRGYKVELIDEKDIDPDYREIIGQDRDIVMLDNGMLIGPAIMAVNKETLARIFGENQLEKCEDPTRLELFKNGYTAAVSTALKPNDDYLRKKAQEYYKKDPSNPIVSYIAGMPVQEKEKEETESDDREDL